MNKIPISTDDSRSTYISASIGVQNPFMNRININRPDGTLFRNGIYTGEGPAKITDAEMDTGYGDPINDGKNGYGLGLRTPENQLDQNELTVAFIAMGARIQVRLDMCQRTKFPCTPTDIFLATALGGDAAISPGVVRDLGNGEVYGEPDSSTGIYQWQNFLDESTHKNHNISIIRQFVNNVSYLQSKGAVVPDVDWKYICSLLK
jgi:hypothetical protein